MEGKSSHAWTVTAQVVCFIWDWISLSAIGNNIPKLPCHSFGTGAIVKAGETGCTAHSPMKFRDAARGKNEARSKFPGIFL